MSKHESKGENQKPSEQEQEELIENEEISSKHDCTSVEKELNEAKEKANQYYDQMMRARAEVENVRKVAEKDIHNAHKFALEGFVNDLIHVMDSLEHALAAHDLNDPAQKKLCEGIELTQAQFLKVFHKFGVEQIDPIDQAFNPTFHQAIASEENKDKAPNTVIKVLQKGYTLKGRLIRPALVIVTKN